MEQSKPAEGMEIIIASISEATFKYTWRIRKYGKLKSKKDSFDSTPFDYKVNGDLTRWSLSIRYWKGKEGKRLESPVVICLNLLDSQVKAPGQATVSFEFGVFNTVSKSWEICPRSRTLIYLPSESDLLSVGFRDLNVNKPHIESGTGTLSIYVKIRLSFTEEVVKSGLQLDLSNMLANAETTGDVTVLACSEKQFHAHSQILCARSPVFRDLLHKSSTIDFSNMSDEAVTQLLRYIYTDCIDDIENNASVLISHADRFQLPGLKTACEKHLCSTVCTANVPNLLLLADQFDCENLKEAVMNFCEGNTGAIQKTMTWKVLEMVNPELFEEVCEAGLGSSVSSNMDSLPSDPDDF